MIAEQIMTGIGLIGIGGLLKSSFDYFISIQKMKIDSKNTFKETRYKSIILLCYALVNFEKQNTSLTINRPDLTSKITLENELQVEFINMSLFASDKVILSMKYFLEIQNNKTLNNLAITMRKDLYGIKTKLKGTDFEILNPNN